MPEAASSPLTRIRRTLVALAALLLVLVPGSGTAGPSVPGTATLQASRQQIVHGGWVRFTGSVRAEAPCQDGREVRLRALPPGGQWRPIKVATSAADGGFSFGVRPEHSARYDVWIPPVGACEHVVSRPALPIPVAARVSLAGPEQGIRAGSCGSLSAVVEPAAPGTPVRFQRRSGGSWTTVVTATLGNSSSGSIRRCERWEDLGTEPWRALWSAEDAGSILNADGASPTLELRVVKAPWMLHIEQVVGSRNVGIAVAANGRLLFERADAAAHVPASNEKLLLSMALLDRVDPGATIVTRAAVSTLKGGIVPGDLWLLGRGDPTLTKRRMAGLANALVSAGIRKVAGSVRGSMSYFAHDWFAPGWKPEFPAEDVALPTALAYAGNTFDGRHVSDPERRAAAALTKMLRARGVKVLGIPGAGAAPGGLHAVAETVSPPLRAIIRSMNVDSVNFDAEVLGKLLGVLASGVPGTIDKGGDAIHAWAAAHGVSVTAEDSSGLSYANRATPLGLVRLLTVAEASPWGRVLRASLPVPGSGTLEHRLASVAVRAKTGTLEDVSALSGWVELSRTGQWASFSIMSGGFDVSVAKHVEDAIVATLAENGH